MKAKGICKSTIDDELRKLDELEERYRRLANIQEACLNDPENRRGMADLIRLLQGIERCIKLRAQLIRENPNQGESPKDDVVNIDLEKLSYEALREVRAALVERKPLSNPLKSPNESKLKKNKKLNTS